MLEAQPGILAPLPPFSRYITLRARAGAPRRTLRRLTDLRPGPELVVGLGAALLRAVDAEIPGMREAPALAGKGVTIPSTPADLWLWLRGDDPGALLHRGRGLIKLLAEDLAVDELSEGFLHNGGRDLSGYEDGTENPTGDEAVAAALVDGDQPGLSGSSFVAVQRWLHSLDHLAAMTQDERDESIGRRLADNEEFDAPPSAHVKRSAQESFDPEAFLVRRSMPWTEGAREGLHFIAFGRSFAAFEAILKRMIGVDDGIIDALFRFTRPITGNYFWGPPLADGLLDLSLLKL